MTHQRPPHNLPGDPLLVLLGLRPAAVGVHRLPGREWEYFLWPADESYGQLSSQRS